MPDEDQKPIEDSQEQTNQQQAPSDSTGADQEKEEGIDDILGKMEPKLAESQGRRDSNGSGPQDVEPRDDAKALKSILEKTEEGVAAGEAPPAEKSDEPPPEELAGSTESEQDKPLESASETASQDSDQPAEAGPQSDSDAGPDEPPSGGPAPAGEAGDSSASRPAVAEDTVEDLLNAEPVKRLDALIQEFRRKKAQDSG